MGLFGFGGVSEIDIHKKINTLNRGILNPNNAPSHFTASQCNDMGFLAMELSSYEEELKQTIVSKSRLKEISKAIDSIEKKANKV